jgi:hypothetical protein
LKTLHSVVGVIKLNRQIFWMCSLDRGSQECIQHFGLRTHERGNIQDADVDHKAAGQHELKEVIEYQIHWSWEFQTF